MLSIQILIIWISFLCIRIVRARLKENTQVSKGYQANILTCSRNKIFGPASHFWRARKFPLNPITLSQKNRASDDIKHHLSITFMVLSPNPRAFMHRNLILTCFRDNGNELIYQEGSAIRTFVARVCV